MPVRKLPPNSELVKLARSGMTHREIAEHLTETMGEDISRVSVTLALGRAGEPQRNKRYSDEVPWTVLEEHLREWPVRMLRLLGRRRAGNPLSETEEGQLNRWLSLLHRNNAVVAYCPVATPGFYYVEADESQDEPDGIPIRPRLLSLDEVTL